MKILHTSDWHLGRMFHGKHMTEDQAWVLEEFIKLVQDVKPHAVVIAGDIYDRSVPPIEAVELLDHVMSKILIEHKTPVVAIAGNHDSPERLSFGHKLLAYRGLHVIGSYRADIEPVVLEDEYGDVCFSPVPYAEPAIVGAGLQLEQIPDVDGAMQAAINRCMEQVPQGVRKVAVGHAFLAGGQESESERPLSVGGSGAVNWNHFTPFNYVALGHLHRPQSIGRDSIRYSGSLLKYSFSEVAHNKSISLVELDSKGNVEVEQVYLRPKRDLRRVEGLLEEILTNGHEDKQKEDYLVVSLQDKGAILDAIGKLRKVYPNVLHIERPTMGQEQEDMCKPQGDYKSVQDKDLFSAFFQQVTNEPMSEEYNSALAAGLEEFYKSQREVK
ncbi:exonuclease SbcD [Desulfitispora alkaliphila]|uniref:exonuclease SbcCD subunit D n=1 Tax=Desulfitispora alkaliphila TaxID=622674 RepID=UPI003D220B39